MKTLQQFLEDAMMATPGNTMGAGNPVLPSMNGEVGSGDVLLRDGDIKVTRINKKRRRRKKDEKIYDKE